MISLYESILESSMLCEAFSDPRLYQAWKTLQRCKLKWSDVFSWRANVSWDKISKEDIEEYDKTDYDKLLKQIRRKKMGYEERPFVLIGFRKERIINVYDGIYMQFGSLDGSGDYVRMRWYDNNQGRNYMTQSEQFARLQDDDYILKVYVDKHSTSDLRKERANALSGAWVRDEQDHQSKHLRKGVLGKDPGGIDNVQYGDAGKFYQMCNKMAQEARERYRKIIAQRKFEKSQDTSVVDDAVNGILSRITTACSNAMKDPETYNKYNLEHLMKMIYDKYGYAKNSYSSKGYQTGKDALLVTYQKYCMCVMSIKTNTAYNLADEVKNRDLYKTSILQQVLILDTKLKEFNA